MGVFSRGPSPEELRAAEQRMQQQAEALREKELREMYHRITRVCFDECVHSMAFTKHILPGEEACLKACALKYYSLSMGMGQIFADMYIADRR